MAHVYGNQATFRRWLSGGDASRDPEMLTVLESSSRAVDAFCNRGSGFGPVHETRTYRSARSRLLLEADLAVLTGITVDDDAMDPGDLPEIAGDYTRVLEDVPRGTLAVEGDWTYPYRTVALGALEAALDDEAETITFVDASAYAPGMTLLIDDEQLLVTAADATTVTVVRGAHGTTADDHLETAPIRTYRYEQAVVDATYRVAQRRWKQRDAGLTGEYGGQGMPVSGNHDTEWSILLAGVSHLRFVSLHRAPRR